MSKTAVYPGTFDPITNGHLDILQRALKIFDKIIILVADNPNKKTLFSKEERLEIIKESTKDFQNVEVEYYNSLLLNFLKQKNTNFIIRGLRAVSDFEYEFQRALLNREVNQEIETVFIMTKDKYSYLSSSIVKEMAMFSGDVSKFVPKIVETKLKEKF
tara:strand:- start:5207 stop:5683 length:477 start_codon:yes stop_codon:yes gene_type:complete